MNINTIIIFLIVAIVFCIVAIVVFAIKDKSKQNKIDESCADSFGEPRNTNCGSSNSVGDDECATIDEVVSTSEPERTTVDEAIDASEPENAEELSEEKHTESADTEELSDKSSEKSGLLNPKPAYDDTKNEVGFVSNSKADYVSLLERIAVELRKQVAGTNELRINYLVDDADELVRKNGVFYLNNEELIINGLLQERKDVYSINKGDRIIVRFGVNFLVPDNYFIILKELKDKLEQKGLKLFELKDAKSNMTSMRASLVATNDCMINKSESLFCVEITEEGCL